MALSSEYVLGYSFVGITSNGVQFPIVFENASIQNSNSSENSATGNGTSVLNGFGHTADIITIDEPGRVSLGNGILVIINADIPLFH